MDFLYPNIILNNQAFDLFNRLFKHKDCQSYLTDLKNHHLNSYHHTRRVGLIALDLGLENQVNSGLLYPLGYGGLLHDIGKEEIPLEILAKTGPLTPEERSTIHQHPRLGFLFAENHGLRITKKIIVAHHEFKRSDPYPRHGQDRRQVLRNSPERRFFNYALRELAQMVAIADLYDALNSARSYKPSLPKEEIKSILRQEFTGDPKYLNQIFTRIS